MSSQIDCTIVIPSRDRPHFFRRCLQFILDSKLNAPVIFIDNSDTEHLSQYLEIVDQFQKAGMDLEYVRASRKLSFISYLHEGFSLAKTTYSVFLSDDDLISLRFLDTAVDFLNDNPDYSSVTGHFVYFSNPEGGVYGEPKLLKYAQGFTAEEDDIIERIHNNELRYQKKLATYLSFDHVRRTKDWVELAQTMEDCISYDLGDGERDEYVQANAYIDEFFMTPIALCNGKTKNIPLINIALQVHPQQQGARIFSDADIITAFEDPKWEAMLQSYLTKVTEFIAHKSGGAKDDIRRILHTLSWMRFMSFVHKGSRNRQNNVYKDNLVERVPLLSLFRPHDPLTIKAFVLFSAICERIKTKIERRQLTQLSRHSQKTIQKHDAETLNHFLSFIKNDPTAE